MSAAVLALLALPAVRAQEPFLSLDDPAVPLTTAEARDHVGEERTVCGVVESAAWIQEAKGKPTFLNLDAPWPTPVFTVVIWEAARARFPTPPEARYPQTRVCVQGLIREREGVPQIVLEDPARIGIVVEPPPEPATRSPQ